MEGEGRRGVEGGRRGGGGGSGGGGEKGGGGGSGGGGEKGVEGREKGWSGGGWRRGERLVLWIGEAVRVTCMEDGISLGSGLGLNRR